MNCPKTQMDCLTTSMCVPFGGCIAASVVSKPITDPVLAFETALIARDARIAELEARVEELTKRAAGTDPNAPKEIWLQLYGDSSPDEGPVDYESDGVTWCWHRINDSDVRYVQARASAGQEGKV